jgi:uncharacterized integral membrane protein (TIGR00697 family)
MHSLKYKYSYYLLAIYLLSILLTMATANKLLYVFDFILPGGIFSFSLTFIINDIAAEVYGYSYPRMFIWLGLMSEFVFSLYSIGISSLSSPVFYQNSAAYAAVFDPTFRFFFASLIGVFISEFLNIICMSRLRSSTKIKSFIFRSLLSTFIGQLSLSIIVDIVAFLGKTDGILNLLRLMLFGFLIKMAMAMIFVVPAYVIVIYLKHKENLVKLKPIENYNPFSLELT